MINEQISRINYSFLNNDEYKQILKKWLDAVNEQQQSIDKPIKQNIRYDRISELAFLNKMFNLKQDELINTAIFSKDFQERNMCQNKLKQIFEKQINKFLSSEKFIRMLKSNKRPIIKKGLKGQILVEYPISVNCPYIKFVYYPNKNRFELISIHDEEYTNKKKTFNDNSSYKIGNRNKKAESIEKFKYFKY